MAAELARMLPGTYFGRELRRLIVTVTSAAQGAERAADYQRTQTFTFAPDSGRIRRGLATQEHAPDDR